VFLLYEKTPTKPTPTCFLNKLTRIFDGDKNFYKFLKQQTPTPLGQTAQVL
jgi:hypothetical protein